MQHGAALAGFILSRILSMYRVDVSCPPTEWKRFSGWERGGAATAVEAAAGSARAAGGSRGAAGQGVAGRGTSWPTGWPCRRWRTMHAASGYVCLFVTLEVVNCSAKGRATLLVTSEAYFVFSCVCVAAMVQRVPVIVRLARCLLLDCGCLGQQTSHSLSLVVPYHEI